MDITLELQKQIMSELEILYKVCEILTIGILFASIFLEQILKQLFFFFSLSFFSQCDSSYIIGFYGAFFVENRISLCTEFMDGE